MYAGGDSVEYLSMYVGRSEMVVTNTFGPSIAVPGRRVALGFSTSAVIVY